MARPRHLDLSVDATPEALAGSRDTDPPGPPPQDPAATGAPRRRSTQPAAAFVVVSRDGFGSRHDLPDALEISSRPSAFIVVPDATERLFVERRGHRWVLVRDGAERLLRCGERLRIGSCELQFISGAEVLDTLYFEAVYETAVRDHATGAMTRGWFDDALARAIVIARRENASLALVVLRTPRTPVDAFDESRLREIVATLPEVPHERGNPARIDGTALAIFCVGPTPTQCSEHVEKVVASARAAVPRLEIGVALLEDGDMPDGLLERACLAVESPRDRS